MTQMESAYFWAGYVAGAVVVCASFCLANRVVYGVWIRP